MSINTPTPSLLIAATSSGCGKTTFTMGLLRALTNRGLRVQPYKCGPDYIDTMFHTAACGRESVNLDLWMGGEEHVRYIYNRYRVGMDMAVVEGVMGLYDGYDRQHGSAAELAIMLDIPVVLIVNARSVAYSVAPLIHGFRTYDPRLRLAGVVFNMVGSSHHYELLREACEDAGVRCLGYMARNEELTVPGRHLGLTIAAREEMERFVEIAAEEVERHVLVQQMLNGEGVS